MKNYQAILLTLVISTAIASQCGCDEYTRDTDCNLFQSNCVWEATGKTCNQVSCGSFTAEDKCRGFSKLGFKGSYTSCYWTGKECKSYEKCSDKTFEAAPNEAQCAGCKVNAADKKCDALPVVTCGSLDKTACALVMLAQGFSGAFGGSSSGSSTTAYDGVCMLDGDSCVALTSSSSCSQVKGELVKTYCNVINHCDVIGTDCKEEDCGNYTVEADCRGSKAGKVCQWDTTCKALDKDTDCANAKNQNSCGSIGCIWTNSACVEPTCAQVPQCPTTATLYFDRKANPQFCIASGSTCISSDASTLTAENCNGNSKFWYRWTASAKCEACSDKSSNGFLIASLLTVAMVGIL